MRNNIILLKCIALGAFSFPSPFLIALFLSERELGSDYNRSYIVIFLMTVGGLVGVFAFYKDKAIQAMKDWSPSRRR